MLTQVITTDPVTKGYFTKRLKISDVEINSGEPNSFGTEYPLTVTVTFEDKYPVKLTLNSSQNIKFLENNQFDPKSWFKIHNLLSAAGIKTYTVTMNGENTLLIPELSQLVNKEVYVLFYKSGLKPNGKVRWKVYDKFHPYNDENKLIASFLKDVEKANKYSPKFTPEENNSPTVEVNEPTVSNVNIENMPF